MKSGEGRVAIVYSREISKILQVKFSNLENGIDSIRIPESMPESVHQRSVDRGPPMGNCLPRSTTEKVVDRRTTGEIYHRMDISEPVALIKSGKGASPPCNLVKFRNSPGEILESRKWDRFGFAWRIFRNSTIIHGGDAPLAAFNSYK